MSRILTMSKRRRRVIGDGKTAAFRWFLAAVVCGHALGGLAWPSVRADSMGFAVETIRAGVQLTWEAEPGLEYTVWWSRTLDAPAWEKVETIPLVVKTEACFFDRERGFRYGFYRIEKKRPMVLVPGSDGGGLDYDFYMGKYEVTNAEFACFLDASGRNGLEHFHVGQRICWIRIDKRSARAFPITGQEGHPVVNVSWSSVLAYCNWLSEQEGLEKIYDEQADWQPDVTKNGYRLPTESEWYKAACWDPTKDGTGGFWRYACRSDEMRGSLANYADSGDPYEAIPPGELGSPPYQTTPVGFYNGTEYRIYLASVADRLSFQTEDAKSYYGCYDMSGNAEEFVMAYNEGSFSAHRMGIHWRYSEPARWDLSRHEPVYGPQETLGFRIARTAP